MRNQKLRAAREQKRWSIETAADKVGISWRTYLRWEHGTQEPHPYNLDQLCNAFGMSPQELGFASETTISTPETRVMHMPPPVLAAPGLATATTADMFDIGMLALILAQQQYHWTLDELRLKVEQGMRSLEGMKEQNQNGKQTSRRDALSFLASLPVAFLGLTQAGSNALTPLFVEEILPLYVTSVPACWNLFFEGNQAEVERVLPAYISHLTPLAHESSKYQKSVASLVSQAYQLKSLLALEHEDFGSSLSACEQAWLYAQLADDPNIQVASLIRRSNTLYYRQRSTVQNNQQAVQYADKISPLLRSRIYSEYACNLAESGQTQEARRYMGLAHDTFPDQPENDPGFLYTHSNQYILYLNTMLFHLDFNEPKDAWDAITKADAYVPQKLSSRRIELLKHFVIGSIAINDLEQGITHFKDMVDSASKLGSDLWISDIQSTHQKLLAKWPGEAQVKELAELFQ